MDINHLFHYTPNSQAQEEDIQKVFDAFRTVAQTIQTCVPEKHAQAAIQQLAQTVVLCRQGIELEPMIQKPKLVVQEGR